MDFFLDSFLSKVLAADKTVHLCHSAPCKLSIYFVIISQRHSALNKSCTGGLM